MNHNQIMITALLSYSIGTETALFRVSNHYSLKLNAEDKEIILLMLASINKSFNKGLVEDIIYRFNIEIPKEFIK